MPAHKRTPHEIARDRLESRTLRLARWQSAGAIICFALATLVTVWIAMTGVRLVELLTAASGFYLAIYLHRKKEKTKARMREESEN